MELIITLVAVYYGLKFLAHLMKQRDVQAAGDELDAALDRTAATAKSCVVEGCTYYLILCVISLLAGIVLSLIHSLIAGL